MLKDLCKDEPFSTSPVKDFRQNSESFERFHERFSKESLHCRATLQYISNHLPVTGALSASHSFTHLPKLSTSRRCKSLALGRCACSGTTSSTICTNFGNVSFSIALKSTSTRYTANHRREFTILGAMLRKALFTSSLPGTYVCLRDCSTILRNLPLHRTQTVLSAPPSIPTSSCTSAPPSTSSKNYLPKAVKWKYCYLPLCVRT